MEVNIVLSRLHLLQPIGIVRDMRDLNLFIFDQLTKLDLASHVRERRVGFMVVWRVAKL